MQTGNSKHLEKESSRRFLLRGSGLASLFKAIEKASSWFVKCLIESSILELSRGVKKMLLRGIQGIEKIEKADYKGIVFYVNSLLMLGLSTLRTCQPERLSVFRRTRL